MKTLYISLLLTALSLGLQAQTPVVLNSAGGFAVLAGCGKSKLEAWQLKHFIVELFYARPRSSAVGDLQLLVA